MQLSGEQQSLVLDLARFFVRNALGDAPSIPPDQIAAFLPQPAGCFVSLHALQGHQLRGCVGRIDAGQPLIEALRAASGSVLKDPRFARRPVQIDELPLLSIEVSVLSAPRPAASPEDFEPTEQGIYLTVANRTGCFLPQVARETGWTREQLLDRLCLEKLGLPASSWRSPQAKLDVFSVQVIGPEPFEKY
jgi:AmmeMemoRadiSam system protein A